MRQQNAQNFVHANDIDLNRGFAWDEKTKKLWIDLRELVDLTSLIINPQTGKLVVNPEPVDNLTKALNAAKDELDDKINDLSQEVNRKELAILENLKTALETLKASLIKVSSDYTDAEVAKVKEAINTVKEQVAAGITLGSRSGLTGKGTTAEPLQLDLNVGSTLQGNGKETALNLADNVARKINKLEEEVNTLKNKPDAPALPTNLLTEVAVKAPITGNGTAANPLGIKLASGSGLIQDESGLRLEEPRQGVQSGAIEGKNILLKDANNQTVSTISLEALVPEGESQGESGDSKGSGYQKFASGIIFQWGRVTEYGDQYKRVEFPIPFPTACISVHATPIVNNGITGELVVSAHVGGMDNTGCSIGTTENGVVMGETSWLAIGY
jgi:hypothetical protein|nr:MAG TPA: putative tail fiber protein [Caudoviricetes sp.]